ncbi:hypothetical protein [Pseudogemmobacter humi]|uniref:Chromosome partition protein Smc n=1 Tax=Pseudogemmobacter humi TaxID=2483812 RepID=A0A3P5XUL6_9RHOB|nr:hypothetical protein [Pseudogemmobacter humi]VDC31757.1 hypothetical protein XINFAN_03112 [Pseudogemmobacter humi]
MQEIVEFERRIAAALVRIDAGVDALAGALEQARTDALAPAAPEAPVAAAPEAVAPEAAAPPETPADEPTLVRMRERLAEAREREAALRAGYEDRIAALTGQIDAQGLELMRLRRTADTLREELRRLHEAAAGGAVDPALINRAMLAELDALRAGRLSEMAELDEISAALEAHLEEAAHA